MAFNACTLQRGALLINPMLVYPSYSYASSSSSFPYFLLLTWISLRNLLSVLWRLKAPRRVAKGVEGSKYWCRLMKNCGDRPSEIRPFTSESLSHNLQVFSRPRPMGQALAQLQELTEWEWKSCPLRPFPNMQALSQGPFSVLERKVRPQLLSEQHNEEDSESMEKNLVWEQRDLWKGRGKEVVKMCNLKGYNPFLGFWLCASRAR